MIADHRVAVRVAIVTRVRLPRAGVSVGTAWTEYPADAAPCQIAEIHALRRDPDNMFRWLDRAWTARDPGIGNLRSDPIMLRYRHDPRFAAFCNKVGLPATTDAVAMTWQTPDSLPHSPAGLAVGGRPCRIHRAPGWRRADGRYVHRRAREQNSRRAGARLR
jgi:hypothetical protein